MLRFNYPLVAIRQSGLAKLICSATMACAVLPAAAYTLAGKDIGLPNSLEQQVKTKQQRDATAAVQDIVSKSTGMYNAMLGYLYLQRGEAEQAFVHTLIAARQSPDTRLYRLATEIALRGRSQASALKAIEMWKTDFPQDSLANNYYLRLLIATDRIEQTSDSLQVSLEATDTSGKQAFIYSIPELFSASKRNSAALVAATPVLRKAMQQPETAFIAATSLARMQLIATQYQQTLKSLQFAATASPPKEKLGVLPNHELLGLIAIDLMLASMQSEPETARQAEIIVQDTLHRSLSRDFVLVYAKALLQMQRQKDAQQQLKNMLKQFPDLSIGWALLGSIQVDLKEWDYAEASLQKYLQLREKEPTDSDLSNSSSFFEKSALIDGLRQQLEGQENTRIFLMLARVADARGNPVKAAEWIARITPTAVNNQARLQRIEWLVQQEDYDLATQQMLSLPASTPSERTLLALLASHIQEKQGHFEDAARILEEAIKADSRNPELLYARGNLYWLMKRYAESEQDLLQVMQLKPNSAAAYNALGYSLADRNQRLPYAHELITKALELDPDNSAIQDSMGWVEYRLGNLQQALFWLKKAFDKTPEAEIAAHYGETLWESGDKAQARKIWEKGLKLNADDKILQETIRRFDKTLSGAKL